jgi:hypothetical protein
MDYSRLVVDCWLLVSIYITNPSHPYDILLSPIRGYPLHLRCPRSIFSCVLSVISLCPRWLW